MLSQAEDSYLKMEIGNIQEKEVVMGVGVGVGRENDKDG